MPKGPDECMDPILLPTALLGLKDVPPEHPAASTGSPPRSSLVRPGPGMPLVLTLSFSKRSLRDATWWSRWRPTSLHKAQMSWSSATQYMFTFSFSCSRQVSPRKCASGTGSTRRWLVKGFLLGWVARRQRSQ